MSLGISSPLSIIILGKHEDKGGICIGFIYLIGVNWR